MRVLPAALLMAALVGCNDIPRHDPPPWADLAVQPDGGLRLDGRPVTSAQLDTALARLAQDSRDARMGTVRLRLRIRAAVDTPYPVITDIQERAAALGIVHIEVRP